MKTLIIYESVHHGNTEKVAKEMAKQLNADMIKAKDVDMNSINNYDLIGFGSGIYFSKVHENMEKVVDSLQNTSGVKAFVFSTSGLGKKSFNDSIIQRLEQKKYDVVGSFACRGYDTVGPFKLIGGIAKGKPDANDMQNAGDFAKGLIEHQD